MGTSTTAIAGEDSNIAKPLNLFISLLKNKETKRKRDLFKVTLHEIVLKNCFKNEII